MSNSERDPVVRRAIDELRKVPSPDHAAISRVVAAAAAARVAPADDDTMADVARGRRGRRWTLVGVAAAAAFAGFALSNARRSTTTPVAAPAASVATAQAVVTGTSLRAVANSAADVLPIAKQFVFNSRVAHSVSVVGDFNMWNPQSARMTRSADGDLWSATLPILPGRHMYAFMVDDSIFVLDPREAKARNSDLGVEASITIVGKP